jgi:putative ABC transport system substrate-binding protein
MRRREFIKLLGGTARAWALAAHAEQPAIPVIGYLDSRSPGAVENRLRGLQQGLKEAGYIEGENVTILYRWADDRTDRLPLLTGQPFSSSDSHPRCPIGVGCQGGNDDRTDNLRSE